jgi:hypothetical protein
MNIQKGKTYKTMNGGSVRIIADDRASFNGKHWVGLYDGNNGEWVVTYDADGTAYVFDTIKPDLSIKPETNKWWVLTYTGINGSVKAEIWSAETNSRAGIAKRIDYLHLENAKVTLVEQ